MASVYVTSKTRIFGLSLFDRGSGLSPNGPGIFIDLRNWLSGGTSFSRTMAGWRMCGEKTAKDGSNGKDSKCQTKGNNMTTRIVVFKWQLDEVIRLEVCNYSEAVNGTTYRKYDNRPILKSINFQTCR
jgi:hypothetical protein